MLSSVNKGCLWKESIYDAMEVMTQILFIYLFVVYKDISFHTYTHWIWTLRYDLSQKMSHD